jgi:4-hydroxybenzoate polyprenyltransferase
MAREELEEREEGMDLNPVQITIETPEGRRDLKDGSLEGPVETEDQVEAEEKVEADEEIEAEERVEGPPSGVDPDTYAIDRELAPATEGDERYPGWRVGFPRKMGAFVELIRPFTLLAPLFGGIAASFLALEAQDFRGFSWATLIYGVATLMLLNAASNCMNAAYDAHIDRINKPYRPIPKGLVTRDEASSLAFVLYFFALFRAILISVEFFILVFLIMFITLYYSMPPVRFKKRFWISNVSIAFARGLLGFIAAWTIFGDPSDPTPWVIGGILFIFLVGATTSKDFTDVEGDAKFGMRTLPVVYGPHKAALITGPFFIIPFALIPVGVLRGYLIDACNYLLALIVWGVYVMVLLQNHATEKDPNFENSPVWKHMYLMLFALYLGFTLVYLGDYYLGA